MNNRERVNAILHYKDYDRMPVVHFGYWRETLQKWAEEGHISEDMAKSWGDGNTVDVELNKILGWDFDWADGYGTNCGLNPGFETEVVKEFPDGSKHIRDHNGVIILQKPDAGSIPAEIEHLLVDRESWEEHYKHRYEWSEDRITNTRVRVNDEYQKWSEGGLEFLQKDERDYHFNVFVGSLYGQFRNVVGMEGACYMYADDEDLFREIIDTLADMQYRNTEYVLKAGAKFDSAHMWEDICFKNGPLITPSIFDEFVGPHYKRITDLLHEYGIDIVSLDCDGCIDALIPTWLGNGVNTMFPIEVGTWHASIAPWREKYGRDIRGVGGMNKIVFARDKASIDKEVERLKPLVDLGGFIPCPDHRIPPDAKWDLVKYYIEKIHEAFGG